MSKSSFHPPLAYDEFCISIVLNVYILLKRTMAYLTAHALNPLILLSNLSVWIMLLPTY